MAEWVERASRIVESAWPEFIAWHGPEGYVKVDEIENKNIVISTKPGPMGWDMSKLERRVRLPAHQVYEVIANMNIEKRWGGAERINDWVQGPKTADLIDEDGDYKLCFVELMNKWPISNREIVYISYKKVENGTYYIIEKSLDAPEVPIGDGNVRASIYVCGYKITSIDDNTSHVSYLNYFDPNNSAPAFAKRAIQIGWTQTVELILHSLFD